jgi:hypothetical protein
MAGKMVGDVRAGQLLAKAADAGLSLMIKARSVRSRMPQWTAAKR